VNIHPKTSAAAIGASLGVVIVGVLESIHGVHLTGELTAAIPALLSSLGSWLAPGSAAVTAPPSVAAAQPDDQVFQ
jgi:hypothetical protein